MTPYHRTAATGAADAADGADSGSGDAAPSPAHRSHHYQHHQQQHHHQHHHQQQHYRYQPSPHGHRPHHNRYHGGGGGGGSGGARSLHPRDHGGPSTHHHNHNHHARARSPYHAAAGGGGRVEEEDGEAPWGGPDGDFAAAFAALRLSGAAEDLERLFSGQQPPPASSSPSPAAADGDGAAAEAAAETTPSSPTPAAPPPTEPIGRALLRLAARLRPPREAHASRRLLAARVRAALARLPELQAYPAPEGGVYSFSGPGAATTPSSSRYYQQQQQQQPFQQQQPDPPAPRGAKRIVVPATLSTFGSTCTGLFFEDSDVDLCLSGFYWREPPCGSWRRLLPRKTGGGKSDGDENDAGAKNADDDLLIPLHHPHRDPYFDPSDPYYEPGYDGSGYQFEGALAPISAMTPQQSNALLTRALAALRAEGLFSPQCETEVVSRARVPVAKWVDSSTGLPCDLCLGNHQAVFKSLFLRSLLEGLSGGLLRRRRKTEEAEGEEEGAAAVQGGPADACPRLRALADELKRAEEGGGASSAWELARRCVAPPPERWFCGDGEEEDEEGDGASTANANAPPSYLRAPPTLLEALYRLVKLWGRQKGANDPARNTLNSWALLQLTLLHLQRRGVGGGGGGGDGDGGGGGGGTGARLLPPLELLFPRSAGGGGGSGADRGGALRPLSAVRLQDHGAPYHLLVGLAARVRRLEARGVLVSAASSVGWVGRGEASPPLAPVGGVFRGDGEEAAAQPTAAAGRLVASELSLFFARWARALHGRLSVRRREADARASTWKGEWLPGRGLFRTNYVLFLEDPFCADDNPARTVGAWNVPGIRACASHLAQCFRRAEWDLRDAVSAVRAGVGGGVGGAQDGKEEEEEDDEDDDEAPAVALLFGSPANPLRGLFAEAEVAPPLVPGQRVFVRGDGRFAPSLPPGVKQALARAAGEVRAAVRAGGGGGDGGDGGDGGGGAS